MFIKKKTKETLAGRIFEFVLSPFNFSEYLRINGIKKEQFKYNTKIIPLFLKYVEKGGFPETFSFDSDRDFKEYVRALVVDKIVYKDAPKIFKIEDPEFLRTLLELISVNPGMYIDYLSIGKQFGKDRRVVKNYILYLKESFLISLLGNYRRSSTVLRKKKRAYPADSALTYVYKPRIDEDFFGKMVETVIVNKLKAVSFWKNGGEIDIIYNNIPIEVKYREKIKNEDLKHLRLFMKKFRVDKGVLITKNEEKIIKLEEGEIKFIPAWKFLLGNYPNNAFR